MRVTCHIGHHKTGTTSLQAYLSQNSNALLRAGILYPWVESQGASIALAKATAARPVERRFLLSKITEKVHGADDAKILPINFREAHNALAFRMLADFQEPWRVPHYHAHLPHSNQMLVAIRNQIKQLQPEEVVLCSEVMSHFGRANPELIEKLHKPMAEAKDFVVWCTLRRPDEQAVSWHGQQIRFGQSPKPLSDPKGMDLKSIHFDYEKVVEPWLARIPNVQLMLRPYDLVMREGGSVQDLVQHSGIRFPQGLLPAPKMNVSRPPAVAGLIRIANGALPKDLANAFSDQIVKICENIPQPSPKDVEYFGAANRQKLMTSFAPIHQKLGQISGRQPFFADIDQMLICKPIPEAQAIRQLLDQLAGKETLLEQPELQDFLRAQIQTYGLGRGAV
ncbi:hypothetical protein [Paracoccus fistulariae]|uniref:Sulfotransferase family protein n=1 Tax=Paracoccus fistulariae TaxID=658446 RepID=A0ABY7SIC2_9RHOB|nr:hypothetical protein [Paracoccus fistulariae]MDB6180986.1 hypothetical protein [Paracoccus fistulariae]WCR06282.1 hypothetical protein JHX87_12350 [Paracoccus fistulariae]